MSELSVRHLPASGVAARGPEWVLWSGWGLGAEAWGPWPQRLREWGPVSVIEVVDPGPPPGSGSDLWRKLEAALPAQALWLGWSWGGMLAAEMAARQPRRCRGLITLASNALFVAREDWPAAMPAATFRAFRDEFAARPEQALRRFQGLCSQGAAQPREVLRALRTPRPRNESLEGWLRGLDWLGQLDTRNALRNLHCPVLHLLASGDALVPATVALALAALDERAQVAVVDGAHALHLSAPEALAEHLGAFLQRPDLQQLSQGQFDGTREVGFRGREKRAVAESFSRAATSYDACAYLQRAVSDHLLQTMGSSSGRWLDLGCGTGASLPALSRGADVVLALDLAEGMLRQARERNVPAAWIGGDAESLPLADGVLDGVFSSLALQWCEDLPAVCAELRRVLRPGGRALIATLGPETLGSLRRAWAAVDQGVHVNRFADRGELAAAIVAAGLQVVGWEERQQVRHYPDVMALARELRALGAHNVNRARPRGLTGRQRLTRLRQALEAYRDSRGLPAEYQVWYLELRRDA